MRIIIPKKRHQHFIHQRSVKLFRHPGRCCRNTRRKSSSNLTHISQHIFHIPLDYDISPIINLTHDVPIWYSPIPLISNTFRPGRLYTPWTEPNRSAVSREPNRTKKNKAFRCVFSPQIDNPMFINLVRKLHKLLRTASHGIGNIF